MRFGTYLSTKKISVARAARALEMEHETVRRYARGLRIPRGDAMTKIVDWTNGEVTANDFYKLERKGSARSAA